MLQTAINIDLDIDFTSGVIINIKQRDISLDLSGQWSDLLVTYSKGLKVSGLTLSFESGRVGKMAVYY